MSGLTIPNDFNRLSRWDQAQFYRSHGLVIHPVYGPKANVRHPGKQPLLRTEDRFSITDEAFFGFFRNGGDNNLGLAPTDNHVVVDLDSKSDNGMSVQAWLATRPELAAVPRERTSGGA